MNRIEPSRPKGGSLSLDENLFDSRKETAKSVYIILGFATKGVYIAC